jgi:hypothetical protein
MAKKKGMIPLSAHLSAERTRHELTQRNANLLASPSLNAPGAVTTTGATGIVVNPDKEAKVPAVNIPGIVHTTNVVQTAKKTGKDIATVKADLAPFAPPPPTADSPVTSPPPLVQGQVPRGVGSDVETLAFRGKTDINKGRGGIGGFGRGMSIVTKLKQAPNKGPIAVPGKTIDPTLGKERLDLQRKDAVAAEKEAKRGETLRAKVASVPKTSIGGAGQKFPSAASQEPVAPTVTDTTVPQVDIPVRVTPTFGIAGGDLGGGRKTAGIIQYQNRKEKDENMITRLTGYVMALYERDFSQGQRKKLAKKGSAMKDGSFPISNEKDLKNAERAIGRAHPSKRAKVRAHIRKRAAALGVSLKGTSFEA